tara:strand:+ start:946 stop:1983 length:1038 start_codon:yes stop_codon:yes gene_type:complete
MSTQRSDLVIPELFTPYLIEETTRTDTFLQSGIVQPLAELNLSSERGGDFVKIPFYAANLTGDFEVLTDSTSLTPGKITADNQIGVVLHRGRAFSSRDLAALAVGGGPDPMRAIGNKLASYVNNQKQKDLYSCLQGAFGSLNANDSNSALFTHCIDSESSDTPTVLSPRHIAQAQSILGDQGSKLTSVAMHSKTFYDLVERRAIDRVYDSTGAPDANATSGTTAGAFPGTTSIPTFMGLNVIVSDDIPTTGSGSSTEYAVFFFANGSVVTGEQAPQRVQTDRDILALEEAMAVDLHYIYHPVGLKYAVSTVNPSRSVLETVGSWSKVYETKNIGICRATVVSNVD